MNIDELEGRRFGPTRLRATEERVADLVAATGDDSERWRLAAPPSFAACALFAVAPALLAEPAIVGSILHGEQLFRWTTGWPLEAAASVEGELVRVRQRSGTSFLTFDASAIDDDGRVLVESSSTFLVVGSVESVPGEPEPPATQRAMTESPVLSALPGDRSELIPLPKSASRADLVRYAAASRDWNPIHWDHDAAVGAGLPGVVCHGLLMAAWLMQAATRYVPGDHPLTEARFRFRNPLRPAEAATIAGSIGGTGILRLVLIAAGVERVSATVQLGS